MSPRLALAVDLGGTQVRAALVAEGGLVVASGAARTRAQDGPQAVVGRIVDLLEKVRPCDASTEGVGVSAPGPLDIRSEAAFRRYANPGFGDVEIVKSALGGQSGLIGVASLVFESA